MARREAAAAARPERRSAWGETAARAALVGAALVVASVVIADYSRVRERHERVLDLLAIDTAARLPIEVGQRLAAEPDPLRADLLLARALVAVELNPDERARMTTGNLDADGRARGERLRLAANLARRALRERPASWEASMLLGAATYLSWSEARDARLFTDSAAWDRPLTLARASAPGMDEPARFLVTAYLELWPALSPAKRETARRLLALAFLDPDTFGRLIDAWLTVADDDEALAAIPAKPFAWRTLQGIYARRSDWEVYLVARERFEQALAESLAGQLREANARRRGGDLAGARILYLEAVANAPPSQANLQVLRTVLSEAPPSPVSASSAAAFRAWLDWTLDLCLIDRCPLPRPLIDRLSGFAGEGLPDYRQAYAALAGRRLAEAELIERRSARLWDEEWGPYLIVKARELTRRGKYDEAGQTLAKAHRSWRQRTAWRLAQWELASAAGLDAELARAEEQLAALSKRDWPAFAWTWSGPRARLELLSADGARGLEIGIAEAPSDGAVVSVYLDGAEAGPHEVRSGETLRIDGEISPGPHLVDFVTVAGGQVRPGAVQLRE